MNSNNKKFNEMFNNYDEVVYQRLMQNSRYVSLHNKHMELSEKLRSISSEEGKAILFELDEIEGELLSIDSKVTYKQGMHDGMELHSTVGIFSVKVNGIEVYTNNEGEEINE